MTRPNITASAPSIDWNAAVKIIERDDSGSELYFEFRLVASGPLSAMVAHIMALSLAERARLIIDGGALGAFTVGEVMALSARADFPS